MTIKVSSKGQIVIPADFRNRFHIAAGDTLLADINGDSLWLRPARTPAQPQNLIVAEAFGSWADLPVTGAEYVRVLRDTDRLVEDEDRR